jgi:hypothetical protein
VTSSAPTRSSLAAVDYRAYRLRDGVYKTLLPPWSFTSQAFALNERGDVGGVAFGANGLNGNGWIWHDGVFKRIDPAPLLALSTVADISGERRDRRRDAGAGRQDAWLRRLDDALTHRGESTTLGGPSGGTGRQGCPFRGAKGTVRIGTPSTWLERADG